MLKETQLQTPENIINVDALNPNKSIDCQTAKRKTVARWSVEDIVALYEMPLNDLMFKAHSVHREYHDPNAVQVSTLLSIKTGGCSEDCGYCPQAARYHTEVENEPMMPIEEVLKAAQAAKDSGASRFCMGAAWRSPKQRDLEPVSKPIDFRSESNGLRNLCDIGHVKRRYGDTA